MNKIFLTLVLIFIGAFSNYAQTQYSRVKIYLDGKDIKELAAEGLAVDHGEYKKGVFFTSDFSQEEISIIKARGYRYEILINNVSEHYVKQNTAAAEPSKKKRSGGCSEGSSVLKTPDNFVLGSMGGFFTYQEMLDQLDSMHARYPNLISERDTIGAETSIEGRPLYWLRISDNPTADENEPEVLYTALHHAREPASMHQLVVYMWYLLENYSDPEIKAIVDNTEMYFVPCINPDGYIYNETTNPAGGGMWRKNRRINPGGTFGVDLNRNYGHTWGYDDQGSSPNSSSDTYRGDTAFSEPETRAIKEFCNAHNFKTALNYHTYGNLLIYPWGYEEGLYTPDSALFTEYAGLLTNDNQYNFGTGDQTVGYVTNGDSDDWMYGEQMEKEKIISMTPEAGVSSEGFWPPANRIEAICMENITQNLFTAKLAGNYAKITDESPAIITVNDSAIIYSIARMGLDSGSFTVTVTSLSTGLQMAAYTKTFNALELMEIVTDTVIFNVDTTLTDNTLLSFIISVNNGIYSYTDTISKIYTKNKYVYLNTADDMLDFTSTTWNKTSVQYFSPGFSITDSPFGNYSNNKTTNITLKDTIDLTNATFAFLSFMARWDIEAGYDFAQVSASANGGLTWEPLCGKYTHPGNQDQDFERPLYDGIQTSWIKEEINISAFLGQKILLRFRLKSDGFVNGDGFYFDDIEVTTNAINNVPDGINAQGSNEFSLHCFPNPAKNEAFITYSLPVEINEPELSVYDMIGNLVHQKKLSDNNSNIKIDLTSFSSGIYFYSLRSAQWASPVKRMVVVK